MDAYGHVNNAVFLNYLEEARDQLLTGLLGDAADDIVIAHVSIDYRREITLEHQQVTVESTVTGWGTSSIRTSELITLPDGSISAEGNTVMVARDKATGRSRPLTPAELDRLSPPAPG